MTTLKKISQKSFYTFVVLSLLFGLIFVTPAAALGLEQVAPGHTVMANGPALDLDNAGSITCPQVVGLFQTVINLIASAAGIIFFIMALYAGIMILFSSGNPEALQRAQQTLIWGAVGTFIALGLVFIPTLIFEDFFGASTGGIFNITGYICG